MPYLLPSVWNSSTGSGRASRTATLPPSCATTLQMAKPIPRPTMIRERQQYIQSWAFLLGQCIPPPVTKTVRSFMPNLSVTLTSLMSSRRLLLEEKARKS